jgi:hypothetical protein
MPDVTVVIPTISDTVLTEQSIPDDVDIITVREGTLNEARNAGVDTATTEKIVLLDDDVEFSEQFFWDVVDRINPQTVVGMEDWNYDLIAGRLMGFNKSTWVAVGGFDERLRSHMGDTDFAIACHKRGYDLDRIPQSAIHHEGPPGAIERTNAWDHAWRGCYLAAKHPTYVWRLFRGMAKPVVTASD